MKLEDLSGILKVRLFNMDNLFRLVYNSKWDTTTPLLDPVLLLERFASQLRTSDGFHSKFDQIVP